MQSAKAKKILIAGGGGIGGITASYLKEASYDVTIYDVDQNHVDQINNEGLFIDGVRGERRVHITAVTTLEDSYDIVFLAVKSLYTKDALETVLPHLKQNSLVVSLQNGVNEDQISKMVGEERSIGCVVGWGATNLGPGHLRQSSKGRFIIGRLDGSIDEDVKEIKKILESVTETTITDNIFGHLWAKMLINCCITTIGVCFAADVKKLVSNQKTIPIMIGLAEELVTVAQYTDITLEKFEDILDMGLFRINDFADYKRAVAIMKLAAVHYTDIKSSMWQDIEKGRKTEIDHLNGYVEQKAQSLGISTPINQALIHMVKEIEQGKKNPSIENTVEFYNHVRIPSIWQKYQFDNDPYKDLALFNLPSDYKHQYAAGLSGLQVVGLLTAFSKAFEKLTQSVIGKIFVRKKAWDIVNLVLTKYIEQMGKKFASNVQNNFSIEGNDTKAILKIIVFFLHTQHGKYTIESFTKKESVIFIEKEEDVYHNAENMVEVKGNIDTPITVQLIKSIAHEINSGSSVEFEETELDGKQGYRITIKNNIIS